MIAAGQTTSPVADPAGTYADIATDIHNMYEADTTSMIGGAVSQGISAIGQIACSAILSAAQQRMYETQKELDTRKAEISIGAMNTKEQAMQVAEEGVKNRNRIKEKRAAAEGKLTVANTELAESKATKEAGKVDLEKLDKVFARNDYFLGRSARPINT